MSGNGVDKQLHVNADDPSLMADGADTTRVVIRVTDEFGNTHPSANDPLLLSLDGPAELIGDNPIALTGGVVAVWVRAKEEPGTARLTVKHLRLGTQTVQIALQSAQVEVI